MMLEEMKLEPHHTLAWVQEKIYRIALGEVHQLALLEAYSPDPLCLPDQVPDSVPVTDQSKLTH